MGEGVPGSGLGHLRGLLKSEHDRTEEYSYSGRYTGRCMIRTGEVEPVEAVLC